jgi:uncharacterized protein YecT (DUF1311 family)
MNIHASEQFEKADNELTELISTIKEASKERTYMELNLELFDDLINEWKNYRDKKATFDASVVEGGTMYPTIYATSLTSTTKEKIESLKNEYATELRKYASR